VPAASAAGNTGPEFSVGGLLFGDLCYAEPPQRRGDGAAGLVARQAYLTFNADFSELVRPPAPSNQSGVRDLSLTPERTSTSAAGWAAKVLAGG
jgi:hypothetical protein